MLISYSLFSRFLTRSSSRSRLFERFLTLCSLYIKQHIVTSMIIVLQMQTWASQNILNPKFLRVNPKVFKGNPKVKLWIPTTIIYSQSGYDSLLFSRYHLSSFIYDKSLSWSLRHSLQPLNPPCKTSSRCSISLSSSAVLT